MTAATAATAAITVEPPSSRARRYDPDRRQRIVDAAVTVIARCGVAATTHRRIAAEADVPLGSVTYHFSSLTELRRLAYERVAAQVSTVAASYFTNVRTRRQFIEAMTDLIEASAGGDAEQWAVTYELYLEALRDPTLREVTEAWMGSSRVTLERFVDPITARGLDALNEGLVMHKILSTRSTPREVIAAAVERAVPARSFRSPARTVVRNTAASDTAGGEPNAHNPTVSQS